MSNAFFQSFIPFAVFAIVFDVKFFIIIDKIRIYN